MTAYTTPRIESKRCDGAISLGMAVKDGVTDESFALATANTDKSIGLAMNTTTEAGQILEVAIPGGGGKALLGESVDLGDNLVAGSAGKLFKANAAGDRIIAIARKAGVLNDIIPVEVCPSDAAVAE